MSKTLTLSQKKGIIYDLHTSRSRQDLFEGMEESDQDDVEGLTKDQYRDAVEAFIRKLRRQALAFLKVEEVQELVKAQRLKWLQNGENEYRSGKYRVVCEGIRGGCWVPYLGKKELPDYGEGLHHISCDVAKDACEEHARQTQSEA